MTVPRRMLVGMRPENDSSPEDLINAPWPGEIQMNMTADIGHILHHTGIDEPSGTWTGGACARHNGTVDSPTRGT